MFRENEIVIMIGAGCSADAGLSTSKKMVDQLENLMETKPAWRKYKELYNYIKSSLLYVKGIRGNFENNIDIERLVSALGELEKKENCILYPFIGNWNTKLLEIAGYDFGIISEFRGKIVDQLKTWVQLKDYDKASYYAKFFDFQEAYNYVLRVFSLNYDLCLEKNNVGGKHLERGFDPASRIWDSRRFYPAVEEQDLYLYKLHGSLDWERDEHRGNIVREVDNIPEVPDLIFGTDFKLYYIDPYLYYASEFRKYSLEAKIILIIGYGFNDEHINSILKQALSYDGEKKLYVVDVSTDSVRRELAVRPEQIILEKIGAKDFLENVLSTKGLESVLKK